MSRKKLKPVIFEQGKYNFNRANFYKQNLLLKAMQQTNDIDKMKKLSGIKTTAELYRTLDKISIRKEYHKALVRQGIDLDTIVRGIKDLIDTAKSESVKLSGYKTFLRSLGLDEYKEKEDSSGKDWEEKMREIVQNEINSNNTKEIEDYEVKKPKALQEGNGEEIIEIKEKDKKISDIYE